MTYYFERRKRNRKYNSELKRYSNTEALIIFMLGGVITTLAIWTIQQFIIILINL